MILNIRLIFLHLNTTQTPLNQKNYKQLVENKVNYAKSIGIDFVMVENDTKCGSLNTSYIDYYTLVLPQLNENGIIIADNVLFHGDVLQETVTGKSAKAIQAFNEHIQKDETTEHTILTIRDGLTLIRKK